LRGTAQDSGEHLSTRRGTSPLFEIALVLVRFNNVASVIVNANLSLEQGAAEQRTFEAAIGNADPIRLHADVVEEPMQANQYRTGTAASWQTKEG